MITALDEFEDEYEETYLRMWNNVTNPKEISCRTALDIVMWCFGPASMTRAMYRTGHPANCNQQMKDLKLCLEVKAVAQKDPGAARVKHTEQSQATHHSLDPGRALS